MKKKIPVGGGMVFALIIVLASLLSPALASIESNGNDTILRGNLYTNDDIQLFNGAESSTLSSSNGQLLINSSQATNAALRVNGEVQIVDGQQESGFILTSDANGNASWQAPTVVQGTDIINMVAVTSAPATPQVGQIILFEKTIAGETVFTPCIFIFNFLADPPGTAGFFWAPMITNNLSDNALCP